MLSNSRQGHGIWPDEGSGLVMELGLLSNRATKWNATCMVENSFIVWFESKFGFEPYLRDLKNNRSLFESLFECFQSTYGLSGLNICSRSFLSLSCVMSNSSISSFYQVLISLVNATIRILSISSLPVLNTSSMLALDLPLMPVSNLSRNHSLEARSFFSLRQLTASPFE